MRVDEKVKRKQGEIRQFFVILVGDCEDEEYAMEEAEDTGDYFDIIEIDNETYEEMGFREADIGKVVSIGSLTQGDLDHCSSHIKDSFHNIYEAAEEADEYAYALIR